MSKLLASLMRNYFPKRPLGAPLHTLSKIYDVPVGYVTPPPLFWGWILLTGILRSPKGGCCSISDDLSCSYHHDWPLYHGFIVDTFSELIYLKVNISFSNMFFFSITVDGGSGYEGHVFHLQQKQLRLWTSWQSRSHLIIMDIYTLLKYN